MSKRAVLCVGSSCLFILTGCGGVRPSVSISDPSVFTSAHIAAVPGALSGGHRSGVDVTKGALPYQTLTDELLRKFRQETSSDDNAQANPKLLVMDEQLDQTQQIHSLAQFLAERLSFKAKVDAKVVGVGAAGSDTGGGDSGGSNPSKEEGASTTHFDEKTIEALEDIFAAGIQDSPFDRLDRAVDFYTAFLLKILPGVGWDTRLLDRGKLAQRAKPGNLPLAKAGVEDIKKAHAEVTELSAKRAIVGLSLEQALAAEGAARNEVKAATDQRTRAEAMKIALEELTAKQLVRPLDPPGSDEATAKEALATIEERESAFQRASSALTQKEAELADAGKRVEELRRQKEALDQAHAAAETAMFMTLNPIPIGPGLGTSETSTPSQADVDRLILLTFQTHIHAGSQPNTMTGVRIRIVNAGGTDVPAHRWGTESIGAHLVNVIRLHPTRSYDVESQAFLEIANQIAEVALSGTVPLQQGGVDLSARRNREEESRERRQFLSRLTKAASFANGPSHEFGWNFYPTNLTTTRRSILSQLGDMVTFQTRSPIQVQAFLEGGARDCAAWLIVPTGLEWIDLEVSYVVAALDPVELDRSEERFYWSEDHHALEYTSLAKRTAVPKLMRVRLPAWDDSEARAFFDMSEPTEPNAGPPEVDASTPN